MVVRLGWSVVVRLGWSVVVRVASGGWGGQWWLKGRVVCGG